MFHMRPLKSPYPPIVALVHMRDAAEIGDDTFHRVEERLDYAEVNAR